MSDPAAAPATVARPSVFLSYASEDREAARVLRDSLPGYGLEVWYDESELGGGEAWDQKIRRQIRECDYFMPLVSTQTDRRIEGYFRREWRLAVERTLDMADDHLFLLPIVLDDTDQSRARVPERFLTVQWMRVPGGRPTPAFETMCRRIGGGTSPAAGPARKPPAGGRPAPSPAAAAGAAGAVPPAGATGDAGAGGAGGAGAAGGGAGAAGVAPPGLALFPVAHEGQHVRFWVEVAGWSVRSAWAQFKRLPRWIRWIAYVWLCIAVFSRGGHSPRVVTDVTPDDVQKLKAISKHYAGQKNTADVAKLGKEIAKEFADDSDEADDAAGAGGAYQSPLLAVAFSAPPGDTGAAKLADAAFAMTYGRAAIAHRGRVGLTQEPLKSHDLGAALARAKVLHSTYVLFGNVEGSGASEALRVIIAKVADGSQFWSQSYPLDADPAAIAADIESNLPSLE